MTNEQLREIINNAPEGATHVDDVNEYWSLTTDQNKTWVKNRGWIVLNANGYSFRSLADLREILALREQNEKLTEWVACIADSHNAIPDWIEQSARSLLAQLANKG